MCFTDNAVTARSMWFYLFVVLVIHAVDTTFWNFEFEKLNSIDNTAFTRIRRNPGLSFLTRRSWKSKTPKKIMLVRIRGDDQLSASRSDYIRNHPWKEPTTETSVPLKNMFQLQERNDISDYIEYLTKMKVFPRNTKQVKDFKAILNGTNYSSISTSNVSAIITSTSNPSVSKYTNVNTNFNLSRPLLVKIIKTNEKKRFRRKSDNANFLDGGDDNSIDNNTMEATQNKKETVDDDSFLIQGITVKNGLEDNKLKKSRTSLNYREKKRDNSRKRLKKRYKSNKCRSTDTEKISSDHTEMNKSYDFSTQSRNCIRVDDEIFNKSDNNIGESFNGLNDEYINHDSKITDTKPVKGADGSKDIKDLEQGVKNITSNLLLKTFDRETFNRLLQMIPWHDSQHVRNKAEKSFTGTNPRKNVTLVVEKNKDDKPVQFVLPKEELNDADTILIVFRNMTDKNESNNTDNVHDNSNTNQTESKYKMAKQLIFDPEKTRKIKKFLSEGYISKTLGSNVILFNKRLPMLNGTQNLFNYIFSNSLYWLERATNNQNKPSDIQAEKRQNNNTLEVNPSRDRKSGLIYISNIWQSKKNKSRSARSSMFRRGFRSPNKFRILVKPAKRNNNLGQVRVQIIRDFEPFEDVMGSLKKYYENNLSPVKQTENHSQVQQVKNKTLDTKRNTTSHKSDMDVNDFEQFLNSYLGLKRMLLGNVAKRYNNSKNMNSQIITREMEKLQPSEILSKKRFNKKKTEKVNLFPVTNTQTNYTKHRVKRQLSPDLPIPRDMRDVKHISETRPDRTNPKLYFTQKVFPNINYKFYKTNNFLPPHVDQDTYQHRFAKFKLNGIYKSFKRKSLFNSIEGVKNSKIQHKLVSLRSQYTGLNKDFNLNIYTPSTFTAKPPISEMYSITNHKSYVSPNVHQIKSTTSYSEGGVSLKPFQKVTQYSTNVKKNNSHISTLMANEETPRTYDITRLTQTVDVKNNKKRELGDVMFFKEHFNYNPNDETFNADIEDFGQAGLVEQLQLRDQTDFVHPVNYTNRPINPKHSENTYFTYRSLKNTVWAHPEKPKDIENNVPSSTKNDLNQDKPIDNVKNFPGKEKDELHGYINLSTARKLYSDLDPLKYEDTENDHSVKNREISSSHLLHAQLDDYNDELLRESNVENNRVGVDYINFNYESGDDLTEHGRSNYDKYAGFNTAASRLKNSAFDQKLPRQNVKTAKHILPKIHGWQKIVPNPYSKGLSQDELYKYTFEVTKPKRFRTFDNMNPTKDILTNDNSLSDDLNPSDVISEYYDSDKNNKKKVNRLRIKNIATNNGKNSKTKSLTEKVYINVPTTTELNADEVISKVNVYVHTPPPIIPKKNSVLHNSRHLVGMWSKNHVPHTANSIIDGVSPLGMWTHKNLYHTSRPTTLEVERDPPEVEFNRRKRDAMKRRSRLICCLMKRTDQQELVKHVKATWGRRCDVIVLITKNVKKNDMWELTKAGLGFIYGLQHTDADWILKADIDSYIVVENLKHMVQGYDPIEALYFGMSDLSDFSNFVISKGALKALVTGSKGAQACQGPFDDGIGYCLKYLGVKAVDSRDNMGRERFYPFSPFDFDPVAKKSDQIATSWSDYAVAFQHVSYQDMYTLDYLIYRIQPYSAPNGILKIIDEIRSARADDNSFTKPPHSRTSLTENRAALLQYLSKTNNTRSESAELDELRNQVNQLKEFSVLKVF